jgi:hypothetical protein
MTPSEFKELNHEVNYREKTKYNDYDCDDDYINEKLSYDYKTAHPSLCSYS